MRIFVVSGYGYWGDFLPTDLDKGDVQIGGGETAMIQVSRHLAKLGHEVVVFYDVAVPGQYYGCDYVRTDQFVPLVCQMEHDVLVSWDNPHIFRFADKSKLHVLAIQLNDAFIGIYDQAIDLYFHPSEWHAERFLELYPEITKEKVRPRATNAVDPKRYVKEVPREPHRVIYSASPDRGLHHLLRMWPAIREGVPEAELHVFYDMDKWLSIIQQADKDGMELVTSEVGRQILAYREEPPEGVTFHGGVGQGQLAIEQLKSTVMAYPCDPVAPTEGFSMTCLEAISAGCSLITTDADALKELWADAPGTTIIPLPVDDEVWTNAIVRALKEGQREVPRLAGVFTWMGVAKRWEQEFDKCLSLTLAPGSNSA